MRIVSPKPEQRQEFLETFHVSLSTFIDPRLLDFDIVKFDKWLQTPDGTSTKDYLDQKYGLRAMLLVEKLIHEIGLQP